MKDENGERIFSFFILHPSAFILTIIREMDLIKRLPLILAASLVVGGCAARPAAVQNASGPVVSLPVTKPGNPKANYTLDQIQPAVTLPAPATQPSEKPSLDAIALYAKSRDELLQNRRFTAINELEKAVLLDPTSPELRQALGRAQLGTAQFNDASIATLEKSAELQPDDLDVQLQLGRQYLAKGDVAKAVIALRRAVLTTDYAKCDDQAALSDFFLATSLQRSGYDRAALDRYQVLLDRIASPGPNLRGNAELNYLISRPEAIWMEMGGLQERGGHFEEALANYQAAAERDADNFELQQHVVRLLTILHRPAAKDKAAGLVEQFGAKSDAVSLLRETYRAFGNESGAVAVLRAMLAKQPNDRLVLFALTTTLQQLGKSAEARDLLVQAARANKFPVDLIDRVQRIYQVDGDWRKNASLLIEASTERPDLIPRIAPLWSRLIGSTAKPRIRVADLKTLDVPANQQAAKWMWISTLADSTNRDALAKSAMEQALSQKPPFTPAYRIALNTALLDGPDSPAVVPLLNRAAGTPALAAELNGIVLLAQKKPDEAESAFRRAIELGAKTPDLQDELVDAVLRQNEDDNAEKMLLQLVSDWPDYEPAYLQLVGFYAGHGRNDQTIKTLETWLANDSTSVTARVLQARFLLETRHPDTAEILIDQLLDEGADNGELLQSIQGLYAMQGRLDVLAGKLAAMYEKQPENRELLTRLVEVYIAMHKPNEASRLVDAARITFAADADGLYLVANLYQRLDQKDSAESTLLAALSVDPKHAPASNDLGYNWVDTGKNLDKAERLVRNAVEAEPDNQAFLDSLGWVLYKRSRFTEALPYLEQASEGARPDPIVLDHLGDALYRVNRKDDARGEWIRAGERLEKIGTARDDLKQLKLQLNAKLKARNGEPIPVAPVIEPTTSRAQAQSN
ncbi:hypothetical protein BH10PLA1_BH10PLA1_07650 [soil metagenome]